MVDCGCPFYATGYRGTETIPPQGTVVPTFFVGHMNWYVTQFETLYRAAANSKKNATHSGMCSNEAIYIGLDEMMSFAYEHNITYWDGRTMPVAQNMKWVDGIDVPNDDRGKIDDDAGQFFGLTRPGQNLDDWRMKPIAQPISRARDGDSYVYQGMERLRDVMKWWSPCYSNKRVALREHQFIGGEAQVSTHTYEP